MEEKKIILAVINSKFESVVGRSCSICSLRWGVTKCWLKIKEGFVLLCRARSWNSIYNDWFTSLLYLCHYPSLDIEFIFDQREVLSLKYCLNIKKDRVSDLKGLLLQCFTFKIKLFNFYYFEGPLKHSKDCH